MSAFAGKQTFRALGLEIAKTRNRGQVLNLELGNLIDFCLFYPPLMTCRGMFYFKVEQQGCCESASGQEDRMRVPYEITHDEGIAKRQVIGVSFFDVQEARMSRVHGCTGATLGTSFLDKQKKSFVHGCTYAAIAWMRRSSDLAIRAKP